MNHRIDLALKDFTPFRASNYPMGPRTGAMNAGRVRRKDGRGKDRRLRQRGDKYGRRDVPI